MDGLRNWASTTCPSPLRFGAQGNILPVKVFEPVVPTKISQAAKAARR